MLGQAEGIKNKVVSEVNFDFFGKTKPFKITRRFGEKNLYVTDSQSLILNTNIILNRKKGQGISEQNPIQLDDSNVIKFIAGATSYTNIDLKDKPYLALVPAVDANLKTTLKRVKELGYDVVEIVGTTTMSGNIGTGYHFFRGTTSLPKDINDGYVIQRTKVLKNKKSSTRIVKFSEEFAKQKATTLKEKEAILKKLKADPRTIGYFDSTKAELNNMGVVNDKDMDRGFYTLKSGQSIYISFSEEGLTSRKSQLAFLEKLKSNPEVMGITVTSKNTKLIERTTDKYNAPHLVVGKNKQIIGVYHTALGALQSQQLPAIVEQYGKENLLLDNKGRPITIQLDGDYYSQHQIFNPSVVGKSNLSSKMASHFVGAQILISKQSKKANNLTKDSILNTETSLAFEPLEKIFETKIKDTLADASSRREEFVNKIINFIPKEFELLRNSQFLKNYVQALPDLEDPLSVTVLNAMATYKNYSDLSHEDRNEISYNAIANQILNSRNKYSADSLIPPVILGTTGLTTGGYLGAYVLGLGSLATIGTAFGVGFLALAGYAAYSLYTSSRQSILEKSPVNYPSEINKNKSKKSLVTGTNKPVKASTNPELEKKSSIFNLISSAWDNISNWLMPPAEASTMSSAYKMTSVVGEAGFKESQATSVFEKVSIAVEGFGSAMFLGASYVGVNSLKNYKKQKANSVFKAHLPITPQDPSYLKYLKRSALPIAVAANFSYNAYSIINASSKEEKINATWEATKDVASLGVGIALAGGIAVGAAALTAALIPVIGTVGAGVAAFGLSLAAGGALGALTYKGLDKINTLSKNKVKTGVFDVLSTGWNSVSNWLMPPAEAAEMSTYRPGAALSAGNRFEKQTTAGAASAFGLSSIAGWFSNIWGKVKTAAQEGANILGNLSPFGPRGDKVKAQGNITTEGLVPGITQHVKDFQALFPNAVLTSAYRDAKHNAAVGGAPGSYHVQGLAFDMVGIDMHGKTADQVKSWAAARGLYAETHDKGSGMHWHFQPIRGQEQKAIESGHLHDSSMPQGGGGGGGKPSSTAPSVSSNVSKNIELMSGSNNPSRLPMAIAAGKANHGITNEMLSNLQKYDPLVQKASQKFGVPVNLIRAHMLAESGATNPGMNHVGAIGVMQVVGFFHAGTAYKHTGSANLYNPEVNIITGTAIIASNLRQKTFNGNLAHAIAAYNAGAGAVGKYGGVPPYQETQKYVATVAKYYHGLSKVSGVKETLDTELLDAYVREQEAKNKQAEADKKIKVHYTASVAAESDSHTHDRHSYEVEQRSEVQVFKDPATARQVARATYPDGTKWTSLWDRHFAPVENSGLDNHFRR